MLAIHSHQDKNAMLMNEKSQILMLTSGKTSLFTLPNSLTNS
jgi:hypothetical protein